MSDEDRIRSALEGRAADARPRDDGWSDVERRLDAPSPGPPDRAPGGHRLVVIVFAFAVFAAAGAFAWSAFSSGPSPQGSTRSDPSISAETSRRVDVYETLIRYLADPEGSQPIYVLSDLCAQLIEPEVSCPDRLTREEQRELGVRLEDLGDIVFRTEDDPGPLPDEQFQEILLGPIVEKPDGLRVEGGAVCGGLCGTGAVYVVVATEDGYEVTGTDDSYGSWIS